MILAVLSLALASEGFDPNTYYKSYSRKELRAAIKSCGFEDVWVGKNKSKRPVVRVKDTSASDEQLICAAAIIDTTFHGSEFSPELTARYASFRAEIARPRQVATARMRFAKEPERGQPPERRSEESDIEIAKRVETFCGPNAKGIFAEEAGRVAVSKEWQGTQQPTLEGIMQMSETIGCVSQASFIAGFEFSVPRSAGTLAPM